MRAFVHKSLTAAMSTPKNTSLTTVCYIHCGFMWVD